MEPTLVARSYTGSSEKELSQLLTELDLTGRLLVVTALVPLGAAWAALTPTDVIWCPSKSKRTHSHVFSSPSYEETVNECLDVFWAQAGGGGLFKKNKSDYFSVCNHIFKTIFKWKRTRNMGGFVFKNRFCFRFPHPPMRCIGAVNMSFAGSHRLAFNHTIQIQPVLDGTEQMRNSTQKSQRGLAQWRSRSHQTDAAGEVYTGTKTVQVNRSIPVKPFDWKSSYKAQARDIPFPFN